MQLWLAVLRCIGLGEYKAGAVESAFEKLKLGKAASVPLDNGWPKLDTFSFEALMQVTIPNDAFLLSFLRAAYTYIAGAQVDYEDTEHGRVDPGPRRRLVIDINSSDEGKKLLADRPFQHFYHHMDVFRLILISMTFFKAHQRNLMVDCLVSDVVHAAISAISGLNSLVMNAKNYVGHMLENRRDGYDELAWHRDGSPQTLPETFSGRSRTSITARSLRRILRRSTRASCRVANMSASTWPTLRDCTDSPTTGSTLPTQTSTSGYGGFVICSR